MLDLVRTSLHRVVRHVDLASRMNVMLGEPICSKEELLRRRAARARLAELRKSGATSSAPLPREQAPVQIYHEGDRNARLLGRMKEMLDGKGIRYTLLDVTGDQPTKEFVMLQARCKEDELPIVFIGGVAVGGYNDLVDHEVSGKLAKALA